MDYGSTILFGGGAEGLGLVLSFYSWAYQILMLAAVISLVLGVSNALLMSAQASGKNAVKGAP
jgi:hypothetical protein